jgi:hypothetical protein
VATFRWSMKEKQRTQNNANNPTDRKAYIITGQTSGIGRATALDLAGRGMGEMGFQPRGKGPLHRICPPALNHSSLTNRLAQEGREKT